jgi:hypothetical protein
MGIFFIDDNTNFFAVGRENGLIVLFILLKFLWILHGDSFRIANDIAIVSICIPAKAVAHNFTVIGDYGTAYPLTIEQTL